MSKRLGRYIWCLVFVLVGFVGCERSEQTQVTTIAKHFFEAMNARDFEKMKELSTKKSGLMIDLLHSSRESLTSFDKIEVAEVKQEGKRMMVYMNLEDVLGNKLNLRLPLSQEKNEWKVDMITYSMLEEVSSSEVIEEMSY